MVTDTVIKLPLLLYSHEYDLLNTFRQNRDADDKVLVLRRAMGKRQSSHLVTRLRGRRRPFSPGSEEGRRSEGSSARSGLPKRTA
jgi:hypothetical protein